MESDSFKSARPAFAVRDWRDKFKQRQDAQAKTKALHRLRVASPSFDDEAGE